jgi:hypothetical protein
LARLAFFARDSTWARVSYSASRSVSTSIVGCLVASMAPVGVSPRAPSTSNCD